MLEVRKTSSTRHSSPYGYIPSSSICLTALILFAFFTVLHIVQVVYHTARDRRRRISSARSGVEEDGDGAPGVLGTDTREKGSSGQGQRGGYTQDGVQTIKYWWILPTLVVGGSLETLGWAGRYWSSHSVYAQSPFLMQICCLILAPAFFSAYCYVLLGQCIRNLSTSTSIIHPITSLPNVTPTPPSTQTQSTTRTHAYSLLSPSAYMWLFIFADLVSLVIQAIGGGGAAIAFENGRTTKKSTNIMVAGILFQLFSMTCFVLLGTDFIVRALSDRPHRKQLRLSFRRKKAIDPVAMDTTVGAKVISDRRSSDGTAPILEGKRMSTFDVGKQDSVDSYRAASAARSRWKIILAAVAFAALTIFVRGIYRAIELLQGWSGYLITHEVYFNCLDFLPMVLCLACFNLVHPGWVLGSRLPGGRRKGGNGRS